MATPQRPLPGNFINTPAPVRPSISSQRPPSFRLPSNSNLQRHHAPTSMNAGPAATTLIPLAGEQPATIMRSLPPLERTAVGINNSLQMEHRFPAIDDYILQGISSDYDTPYSPPWAPFEKVRTFDIPDRVLERLNATEVSCKIGLFAELHHAWAAVDSVLYLWDYTHPNPELAGYDELQTNIEVVRLTKPKPGVFRDEITHVILLATVTEVVILGLQATTSPSGVISVALYQTDLKVPIRATPQCLAASSKSGRVFFGCENSEDIFEITYQNEEKWFSSRCGKIKHTVSDAFKSISPTYVWNRLVGYHLHNTKQIEIDDTRDLLYVLSSESWLRVFRMKGNDTLQPLIEKKWDNIMENVAHMVPGPQSQLLGTNQGIASISIIPENESSRLALMATTITGVRIYFSMTSGGYYFTGGQADVPYSMQVHHVKFPPKPEGASSPFPNTNIHSHAPNFGLGAPTDTQSTALIETELAQRFPPGYYFNVVKGSDSIFVTAPDSARLARPPASGTMKFMELGQWLSLGHGSVYDVGLVTPPFKAFPSPVGFGNELVVQFDQPATEVAIITNMGVYIIKRNRLVDNFSSLLRTCSTTEEFEASIKEFVRLYGRKETCATALAVACGQAPGTNSVTDPMAVDLARRAFIEHGGKPDPQEVLDNSTSQIDSVRPSPRALALVLYTSRLIRSSWRQQILQESPSPATGGSIKSTVSIKKLQTISQSLINLQEFLDSNKNAIPGLSGPEEMSRAASVPEQVALQAEHRVLDGVSKLVRNCTEGIAFLIQLFESPVAEILLSLPDEERKNFKSLTYEALFTTDKGKLLAKEVVKGLVSRSISDGSNVDTVADSLRRRCGSFCSADDVVIFKAQEQLQKATNSGPETATGRALLNESLRLLERVAGSLPTQYLEAAVSEYIRMSFYAGAIKLCLNVAQQRDRANRSLACIKDGSPQGDSRKDLHDKRIVCYNEIWKVIEAVDAASSRPAQNDADAAQIAKRKDEAYSMIDESEDEVFQNCLYDWYLQRNLAQRLLDLTSPYVISYLKRKSENERDVADLLWRYYAHHRQYFEAAKVQLQLAKSGFPIDLPSRIEYLSRAKANASARTPGFGDMSGSKQAIMSEIGDQLDCATVQLDTLRRLEQDPRMRPENLPNIVEELNSRILSLDGLYHDYVLSAGYHDICLVIYHLSDYRNEPEIAAEWRSFIQEAHEEAVAKRETEPHVLVQERVRGLGRRVNCSETIFNPLIILGLLLDYMFQSSRADTTRGAREWPVDLLFDVGVPSETVLAVLENLQFNDGEGWSTAKRRVVAALSVYVSQKWLSESVVGGGLPFGGEEGASAVLEVLRSLSNMNLLVGRDGDALRDMIESIQRVV